MTIQNTRTRNVATLASGMRLPYIVQGQPTAPAVVMIHGWPDSAFSYSRVLEHLVDAPIRAYAYDQRGFGNADRPAGDACSLDQFAADALAFMDALDIPSATLVGHSFGSFVARRAAQLRPDRVAGLVLMGSAPSPRNAVTTEVLEAIRDLRDPLPIQFVRDFQASTLHLPVPDAFFDGLVDESRKAPARVWRDSFASLLSLDDSAELARLAAPALVIWGEHDALFASHAEQQQLVATMPNARLVVYRETGHSPNWERPERVARDIAEFVAQVTA